LFRFPSAMRTEVSALLIGSAPHAISSPVMVPVEVAK
jgi:hypothetical protein